MLTNKLFKGIAIAKQTIISHYSAMREIIIYSISGCASLFILGYTVHIFIGGLVEPLTETISIIIAVLIGAAGMAWMVWDILKSRRLK